MLASLDFSHPLYWYILWNLVGFSGAFIVNSFVEWAAHRFILHDNRILKFPYELHDRGHHLIFRADETYHAQNDEMREHIIFVARDFFLFLTVTTPLWVLAEILIGRPFIIGGVLATLAGLQAFNSLHLFFHDPSDTWFQKTRLFLFLKNHHKAHHADTRVNFNVVYPLADWVLGTLKK